MQAGADPADRPVRAASCEVGLSPTARRVIDAADPPKVLDAHVLHAAPGASPWGWTGADTTDPVVSSRRRRARPSAAVLGVRPSPRSRRSAPVPLPVAQFPLDSTT